MTKTLAELTTDVLQLPNHQRLALAKFLLDLDEPASDSDVESVWDDEIGERVRAVDEGRASSIPYDQVLFEIENQFPHENCLR
jgi:hypothetical protein